MTKLTFSASQICYLPTDSDNNDKEDSPLSITDELFWFNEALKEVHITVSKAYLNSQDGEDLEFAKHSSVLSECVEQLVHLQELDVRFAERVQEPNDRSPNTHQLTHEDYIWDPQADQSGFAWWKSCRIRHIRFSKADGAITTELGCQDNLSRFSYTSRGLKQPISVLGFDWDNMEALGLKVDWPSLSTMFPPEFRWLIHERPNLFKVTVIWCGSDSDGRAKKQNLAKMSGSTIEPGHKTLVMTDCWSSYPGWDSLERINLHDTLTRIEIEHVNLSFSWADKLLHYRSFGWKNLCSLCVSYNFAPGKDMFENITRYIYGQTDENPWSSFQTECLRLEKIHTSSHSLSEGIARMTLW